MRLLAEVTEAAHAGGCFPVAAHVAAFMQTAIADEGSDVLDSFGPAHSVRYLDFKVCQSSAAGAVWLSTTLRLSSSCVCTHCRTIDACVSWRCGPRCEIVGIVSRQLIVRLSRVHTVFSSHLHLYCIAMWHVHYMVTVITVREHASWSSPLHMMVCVQAISVHGQTVTMREKLLRIRKLQGRDWENSTVC